MLQSLLLGRVTGTLAWADLPGPLRSGSWRNVSWFEVSWKAGTFVGWGRYFSRCRGEVPPLPEPVQVEPVEDKGTLIILMPERFSTTHPGHLELWRTT